MEAYRALGCTGLARVDFFALPDGGYLLNEVNTLPGFTSISMYPKLMTAAGDAGGDVQVGGAVQVLALVVVKVPLGVTSISMYPKLMTAAGMTYSELLTRLIQLAIEPI